MEMAIDELPNASPSDKGLYRKIWKTKSCRYQARNRIRAQNRLSQFTVAMLSLYIIALSLYTLAFAVNENLGKWLQIVNIVSSIFIVIVSLIESSKSYDITAFNLHESAHKFNSLFNELQFILRTRSLNEDEARHFVNAYNEIILQYDVNHESTDYDRLRACDRKYFKLRLHILAWLHIKTFIIQFGFFVALILFGPVGVAVAIALH